MRHTPTKKSPTMQHAKPVRTAHAAHTGKKLYHKDGYDVIACNTCGFTHLKPFPTTKALNAFYAKDYYQKKKPDYIQKDIREEAYWELCHRERLDTIAKKAPGKNILDVGCGTGFFLKTAKKMRWTVQGIEISDHAAIVAKKNGIPVFIGSLEEYCQNNKRQFDAIHLKNVLEHVPKPQEMIAMCHSLLNDGGVLCVEVPNDFDIIQRLGVWAVHEKPSWIAIPDHINYFNFRTLRRLLKRQGFHTYYAETTFPMYLFLLFGQNFIKNPSTGSRMHQKRMNGELFLYRKRLNWLKRATYWLLAKLGTGRTVLLYCQKTDATEARL